MAPRKPSKSDNPIDPIVVIACALKACKCASDFHRIGSANTKADLEQAWQTLSEAEQQRITALVNANTPEDPQSIADELMACGTALELKRVKSEHGDVAVKSAWKLLPGAERDRIKMLCDTQAQPQPEPEPEPRPTPEPKPSLKKPTLIDLTAELSQLDNLLDTIDGDNIPVELQTAVDELLDHKVATQSALLEKLDNYAALIQNRAYWAATRKAELERLSKLIESDQKTIDFLKGRLKAYLEATEQKKVRTKRFNISISANGGKQPLHFDDTPPEQMPERFQRLTVEPNREVIRTALEAGEDLSFAYLAERQTYLRIK